MTAFLIESKSFTRPIERRAHFSQLLHNGIVAFLGKLLDPLDEFLTGEIVSMFLLFFVDVIFYFRLGCD